MINVNLKLFYFVFTLNARTCKNLAKMKIMNHANKQTRARI